MRSPCPSSLILHNDEPIHVVHLHSAPLSAPLTGCCWEFRPQRVSQATSSWYTVVSVRLCEVHAGIYRNNIGPLVAFLTVSSN